MDYSLIFVVVFGAFSVVLAAPIHDFEGVGCSSRANNRALSSAVACVYVYFDIPALVALD